MALKIILLNPPTLNHKKFIREGRCTQQINAWATLWPPVSLATIAGLLISDGNKVQVFDCPAQELNIHDLKELLSANIPDFVIWSTGTPSIESDLHIACIVKEINPKIKTAVFGTHVSVFAQKCLSNQPALDFIIRNEPEFTIQELVNTINDNQSLMKVKGITYRTPDNKIINNPVRPFINNLDVLPFPTWNLIAIERYRLPLINRKYLIIAPTRGCPYNCSFCTSKVYYGKALRRRSINIVLSEIKFDIENYNVRDFLFWSDTFTLDKKYVRDLSNELIKSNLNIHWTCNSRVDTVDESLLKLMAQAGCWMISFGIESGNQEILDITQKGTNLEQAYLAVNAARKNGIKTVGHFILGLPGETNKTIRETIGFSKNLKLDLAQFYCAVPFPGSTLYDTAVRNRWIDKNNWHEFSQDIAIMQLQTISTKQVNNYRKKAIRIFYFRFHIAWRLFLLLAKHFSLKGFTDTINKYLKWIIK
ncbi:MAG: B12-binding domain-containing radical SAM protein [Candidatus Hodarchaeota archaeon]